jgi:hypothetical protein
VPTVPPPEAFRARGPLRHVRAAFSRLRHRLRRPGRPAAGWTLRLTLAAVASYVVAERAFPESAPPLLAPLTALLVVQLTPVSILESGLDRVVSVVAGVGLAVLFSSAVGLNWWSLGLLIGLSLVVGQVLRLGENLLEVPISAMLVLGVGAASARAAAGERIAETLVGAAVGVLSSLFVPPPVVVAGAAGAIGGVGDRLADLLGDAADELASDRTDGPALAERAGDWLGQARSLTYDIPVVGRALIDAEESRRVNVRALGRPDAGPGLRQGLEALEHSLVAIRSMFGTFEAVARRAAAEGLGVHPALRGALAVVLHELADAVRGFGRLVREEADPAGAEPDVEAVRAALEGLQEARARITDLLLVNPRDDLPAGELVVTVSGTVERLLRELDLEERAKRLPPRPGRQRRYLPRIPAGLPPKLTPKLTPKLPPLRTARRSHEP